jgi:hypothetical protein
VKAIARPLKCIRKTYSIGIWGSSFDHRFSPEMDPGDHPTQPSEKAK